MVETIRDCNVWQVCWDRALLHLLPDPSFSRLGSTRADCRRGRVDGVGGKGHLSIERSPARDKLALMGCESGALLCFPDSTALHLVVVPFPAVGAAVLEDVRAKAVHPVSIPFAFVP